MESMHGLRRTRHAFTLVEVMIIVALIALLVVLAIPSFIKVRKQSQGKRIINDARAIDAAVDGWALENAKTDGDVVDVAAIGAYTTTGVISTNDVLNNPYSIGPVGTNQVRIATASKTALSGVSIDWGTF